MGWPQYTYLVLTLIGLGVALAKNGEARTGEYSFWLTLFTTFFVNFLLYSGGFFSK